MKRGFMRAYWGEFDAGHRITKRKARVDSNITKIHNHKFNEPFITYVFGRDNYDTLTDMGFDCVLLHDEPYLYDAIEAQYRHKLHALQYAMEEDGFDEMVHLDWDCIPQKKLSVDFWQNMGKKEIFQACLLMYHRKKATWRKQDVRKIPNGGYVYIRDKGVPAAIIKEWEKRKGPSAEPPMARYTDALIGGWKDKETYWELFEPDTCNLHKSSPYSKELLASKDICFIHYQG